MSLVSEYFLRTGITLTDFKQMYKNVALTGATGTMGRATMEALLKVQGLNIKVLARKSKKNIKLLSPLTEKGAVSVVWEILNPTRMCCLL